MVVVLQSHLGGIQHAELELFPNLFLLPSLLSLTPLLSHVVLDLLIDNLLFRLLSLFHLLLFLLLLEALQVA